MLKKEGYTNHAEFGRLINKYLVSVPEARIIDAMINEAIEGKDNKRN